MSNQSQKNKDKKEDKKVGLPTETSPYTQYKDVEDYKRQGYGTEGHQQVQPGRGGGATDGPTLSGDDVARGTKATSATDVINRHGVN